MIIKTLLFSGLFFIPSLYAIPQSVTQAIEEENARPDPVIEFQDLTYDVGETWEGDNATHTFSFKNTGDAVLVIKKVKTSCGCTAAVLSSKEIKPGEVGEIEATFNTKRYRGKQSKTIYVSSNDPKHPTVQLKLQTTIKSAGTFQPRNIQFGEITRGDSATQVIELKPDGEPIRIAKVTATPDIFSARIIDDKNADAQAKADGKAPIKIEVTVSPDAPIGRHNGNLNVDIDHPRVSSLSAHLYIRVAGPIKFTPRMLFFDENAQKNRSIKNVRLTKTKGTDLEIVSVESSSPQFQAEAVVVKPGREVDIKIQMAPNVAPGRYQGEVAILTNCPEQKEIKIPVRSNIRNK